MDGYLSGSGYTNCSSNLPSGKTNKDCFLYKKNVCCRNSSGQKKYQMLSLSSILSSCAGGLPNLTRMRCFLPRWVGGWMGCEEETVLLIFSFTRIQYMQLTFVIPFSWNSFWKYSYELYQVWFSEMVFFRTINVRKNSCFAVCFHIFSLCTLGVQFIFKPNYFSCYWYC